ncbi:hypothetical protein [Neomegalonema sp.]|uniref:hypothetical protein n=1 Tax=Neomegalonema sp. TaxID=2039713 RepID=UPI002622598A|nr:hypothetical protein [Neomegalonema sp.]MDD2869131.1 hypothetical protein [Neomegalonema sp.]
MSFFSNLRSWVGRLFGGRPNPTQALREEIARHRPTGVGLKTSAAPPLKAEPTPYPRGGAAPPAPPAAPTPSAAPPAAPLVEPKPAPARSAQEAPERPPAADPAPAAAPPALAIGEARRLVQTQEAAFDIPEPAAPPPDRDPEALAGPAPAEAPEHAAPAPPPILPPISLLAPPLVAGTPKLPAQEAAEATDPDHPHSPTLNVRLNDEAQPADMMKLDLAPPSALLAPPVLPLDFEEDQEDLVDLSLVDEDMEALDARTLTRARPLLAAPPLDMLVARWRAALSRMQGPDGAWALFKHGTVVLFEVKPRNAEAEARALLKTQIAPRSGVAPEPEVTALPNGGGWLVGGEDPRLFTYVAPEEASSATPSAMIGRLGRAKRDEDARDLEITHIENDPFWRPPED